MRRALALLALLAGSAPALASARPGPTPIAQPPAPGGLAARAEGIRLNRRTLGEMSRGAPPRPRTPVLKGGRIGSRPRPAPLRRKALPGPARRSP